MKSGSIPLEHPAMIEIVPVGARVVNVAFLINGYFLANVLPSKFGKDPRSFYKS